jgi:hypothetical protein
MGTVSGDTARQKTKGGVQDQRDRCLQVGVLVAMPSQRHTKSRESGGLELCGGQLWDGLAIGLTYAEMLWIEDRRFNCKKVVF